MAENNKDKPDEDKTTKKKTNRGIIWPDTATFELLNFWKEENIRLALENTKSPRHTRAIYQDITVRSNTTILKGTSVFNTYDFYCLFSQTQMHQKGFTQFLLTIVMNKVKKLNSVSKKKLTKRIKQATVKENPGSFPHN